MNSPATIDDLPVEMVYELFRHLNPKDLTACCTVNKRWHSIYAAFKLDRLFIVHNFHRFFELHLVKWRFPDRKVEEHELVHSAMFGRLLDKPLLSNLKHLALTGYPLLFQLEIVNNLTQLVHLEIHHLYGVDSDLNLNLPNLKALVIYYMCYRYRLSIDCPKLSLLVYSEIPNQSLLDVKQPETIKKLVTNMVGSKLVRFKNVQCLVALELNVINQSTLLSLPNLKELHFNQNFDCALKQFDFRKVGSLNKLKRMLKEFLVDVKALRRPEFRFRFAGFELTEIKLDQIEIDLQVKPQKEFVFDECVYTKNYQLIEPGALDFIQTVDYSRLMANVPAIPRCFLKKFTCIHWVKASSVSDPDHLLEFLKSLGSLTRLHLIHSELNQSFYDRLPAFARSLIRLQLDINGSKELQLSLDFIPRFLCLSWLWIRPQDLPFESITAVIRWLGKLEDAFFVFTYKKAFFAIRKLRESRVFQVLNGNGIKLFGSPNPEAIVDFLTSLACEPDGLVNYNLSKCLQYYSSR